MKPLNSSQITPFLERFSHAKDGEIRSLEILSPTKIQLTLTAQDSARAYDWVTLTLLFENVEDAYIPQEKNLAYLPMDEGVCILNDKDLFAFGIGECYNSATIKSAPLYIFAQRVFYQEGIF